MSTSNARKGNPSDRVNPGNELPNESMSHFDSKHIETVKVDLRPLIELCKQGNPRPTTTTIGELPANYDPVSYVHNAKRIIFAPDPKVQFTTDDHFWFVTWFEQHASYEEREKYKLVYPFALSGIGLLKSEQKDRAKRLKIHLPKYAFREPSSGYYPYALPLSMFQLLMHINELEDNSRKWKANLFRCSRMLNLFWHSNRLARAKRISGKFSKDYLIAYVGSTAKNVLKDLNLLEKYQLIYCIGHGYAKGGNNCRKRTNRFKANIPLQGSKIIFPLVLISKRQEYLKVMYNPMLGPQKCPSATQRVVQPTTLRGIKYGFYSVRCEKLMSILYSEQQELDFITDTWERRTRSSKEYRAKMVKAKQKVKEHAWLAPEENAKALLNLKTERTRDAILQLNRDGINREYLYDLRTFLQNGLETEVCERKQKWFKTEMLIAHEMLNHGLVNNFEYTRSGRIKAPRSANPKRSGVFANHLNTSRKYGKQGYFAVWGAIKDAIADIVDVRSAEPLVAAICTGDKALFDDYTKGDVYQFAVDRLDLPGVYNDRSIMKNKLWLPVQYGSSLNRLLGSLSFTGLTFPESYELINYTIEAYHLLKDYLKASYPLYWSELDHLRNIGRSLAKWEFYPKLPNGITLEFDRGAPHSVPPIVMQSYVSLITTAMFHAFWEESYEPVFDIHDAVVTRKPIPKEFANQVVREVVLDLLRRHKRNWAVPEDVEFVTVEHLNIKPISLDEFKESEQLTEDYITELLDV